MDHCGRPLPIVFVDDDIVDNIVFVLVLVDDIVVVDVYSGIILLASCCPPLEARVQVGRLSSGQCVGTFRPLGDG